MIAIILIAVIGVIIIIRYVSIIKILKNGNFILIDGTIKSGKSLLTIWLAIWKVKLYNLLHLKKKIYIYSNIPLKTKYIPITLKMIERKVNIIPRSIVIFDEASLIADSMLYNDKLINEEIQLFVKLFAHWSKGGTLIYNTQNYKDLHFDIKRCVSNYYAIVKSSKTLFFHKLELKQVTIIEDNSQISEDTIKVYVPKFIYKYYDRYCFSILTDSNIIYDKVVDNRKAKNLKQGNIITFRKFRTINNDTSKKI